MKRKSLPTGRDFLFVEGYGNENPGAFQSTRPLRGATSDHPWRNLWAWVFQPTRPLRGATGVRRVCIRTTLISTHAPLAGRDQETIFDLKMENQFQPTRPLRGATSPEDLQDAITNISTHAPLAGRDCWLCSPWSLGWRYFNPRAPCGARPVYDPSPLFWSYYISTHAPLAGRDGSAMVACHSLKVFQPTRPLRGATMLL